MNEKCTLRKWRVEIKRLGHSRPADESLRHGMFFSVWKKQSDGSWRVALDLGGETPAEVAPLNAPFKTSYQASGKGPTADVNVEEEIAGLLKVEREFLAAAKADSLGQAYRSRLSDDARVHRPGVMPVAGKDALRDWLARQTMTLSGEPIKADVSRSGDLGYAYGSYELGGAQPQKGYFARVWKRDAKGQWRIVMDIVRPLPPETPHLLGRSGGGLSATGQRETERPCSVASSGDEPDLPQSAFTA